MEKERITRMLTIDQLIVQYDTNPLGIDEENPGLSWQLKAEERGQYQSAYQILVSLSNELLNQHIGSEWDTGKISAQDSQHIVYQGKKLESRAHYFWKVKVWDREGRESAWSEISFWEMGLLEEQAWKAQWITAPFLEEPDLEPDLLHDIPVIWDAVQSPADSASQQIRYFRFGFDTKDLPIQAAKLQTLATDSLLIYVNHHNEGLYYPYEQSVTLDITDLLECGSNVIACKADGVNKGFIAVISITYCNGESELFSTADDDGWRVNDHIEPEWASIAFNDSHWRTAVSIGRCGQGNWSTYKRILYPVNKSYGPCPVFGYNFKLTKSVKKARLYVSALGLYQSKLNGMKIGNDLFTPGWTDYRQRIPYQTYDITPSLQSGDNVIEAVVGPGWYAGNLGIVGPFHYGAKIAFRAQLHIEFVDDTSEIYFTDEQWSAAESPVVEADIYMGETYDARKELSPQWQKASLLSPLPTGLMQAQMGPPIRENLQLTPQSLTRLNASTYLLDMGQNMVGWARIKVTGPRGTRITIRYAERLGEDGRLYRANLRTAKQTDVYLLKGGMEEQYEPAFTYHGFQYVEIEGFPGELTLDKVVGIVVYSAAEEVGNMETSHSLINRLIANISWSQRGNFFGIPLDCPQRDERLGWLGDAHAYARTATYNMNCAGFYGKWLTDIREAQRDNGAYTDVAPFVDYFGVGNVFFGDGGVIMPWVLYKVYADDRFIKAHYPSMKKWIDYLVKDSDEQLLRRTLSYADHLSYGAETPQTLINAAFFAYSVKLVAEMAGVIGKTGDAAEYMLLFKKLKLGFQTEFVAQDGRISCGTQTAYILALKFGLLPDELEPKALQYLLENIKDNKDHLTTGFMGVSYALSVLSEFGEIDTAFRLLLQESFPSWLYPVKHGATTIWERWDGWVEEIGLQDPEMNSFNHFALGSVGEWIYRYLAGVDLAEDAYGFQRFLIRPCLGGNFTWVSCRYKTLYGWIESSWEIKADIFTLKVEIPVNTTAEIAVPASIDSKIYVDGILIAPNFSMNTPSLEWTVLRRDDKQIWIEAGSGRYEFNVSLVSLHVI